jgi:hypothetical protein
MNFNRSKFRKFIAGAALVGILGYNFLGRPYKTVEQSEYENWLVKTDKDLRTSNVPEVEIPDISLQISSPDGQGFNAKWQLDARTQPGGREHILRILHLVEESDILAISNPRATNASSPLISLHIKDSKREFTAQFNESDIVSNVKVHLMLRLFQEYAQPPKATSQMTKKNPRERKSRDKS